VRVAPSPLLEYGREGLVGRRSQVNRSLALVIGPRKVAGATYVAPCGRA
jgi:hypothetical protein